ncbi:MAG TPA: glycosyltransferase family 39 protein [Vicinamibacteria bacterium]|nr:glycosyltransferase family 39 protein [Vicinamibacteria bacterium]
MRPNAVLPARGAALLLALVLGLLLFRLGDVPLLGPDEPRYARVAVEMHRRGDWVVPTLQERPWLEKPPLYYWLAGIAFSVLGENETAARLPSAVAAVALTGATALVGARLYGGSAGLHAGFVAGLALLTFVYGRAAAMDMLLAAAVTASAGLLGLRLLGIAGGMAVVAAGACAGVGLLAKGPLGALLPALVAGAMFVFWPARAAGWRRIAPRLPLALLALVVVAAPWYVAIVAAVGREFVDVFLLDHNLARFTSTIHRHPGPFYYYLPLLLAGLFPWSGLLAPGLASLRPRAAADLFVLCWLGAPLVFFSAAGSKLPGYILPCLPPLAIAAGRAADALVRGDGSRLWSRVAGVITVVLSAVVAAVPLVLRQGGEPLWTLLVPPAAWSVLTALVVSARLARDPAGALSLLRVGAAGLLLLLAGALPPLLARRESGRELFRFTGGREVLAWNAWRTAWMAGYFYNDGRVRPVARLDEVAAAAAAGPVLVVCGPGEERTLRAAPGLLARTLAQGPRGNVLLRVRRPAPAAAPAP